MPRHFLLSLVVFILFLSQIHPQSPSVNLKDPISKRIAKNISKSDSLIQHKQFFLALKCLKETSIFIKDNQKNVKGSVFCKMGEAYINVGQYIEAQNSLYKAIKIQRALPNKINKAETYYQFGILHYHQKNFKTALQYFTLAKINFRDDNTTENILDVRLYMGKTYKALNLKKRALATYQAITEDASNSNLPIHLSNALINKAELLQSLGDLNTTKGLLDQGLKMALKHNNIEAINHAYLLLSKWHENQEEYQLSSNYFKKHIYLSDSLLGINREKFSAAIQQKNIHDFNLFKLDDLVLKLEGATESEKTNRILILGGALLILIIGFTVRLFYKNDLEKRRASLVLYEKNRQLTIAKNKAELAAEVKTNFLSTVTHELRTPLYTITGLSSLLVEEDPKPTQIDYLNSLKYSADHLLLLINDVLQMNKIEAKKLELDNNKFNLKEKIDDTLQTLKNQAQNNNVTLHFNYDKNLPLSFIGDDIKLSQILINLIGNAIKFSKNGDIWLSVSEASKMEDFYILRFKIKDNGIGISKENQKHIFDSFEQASVQVNRVYGGTGLGLAIVKGLIDIFNGTISLKSELGKGTTVTFEIPYKFTAEELKSNKEKSLEGIEKLNPKNIKILIVEDNRINLMITERIVKKMNFSCDSVYSGEEAIEKAKAESYDVILMDIYMPGIGGVEATNKIKEFDKNVSIFALTAVALDDKFDEFKTAGFDDIISKPFKIETFNTKIIQTLLKKKNLLDP